MKLLLALLLIASPVFAQSCTTSVCTAASLSQAAVTAALPSSSNANATVVVNLPAGTGTWTGQLSYTIPPSVTNLTIQGKTTVTCTGTAGMSNYACSSSDQTFIVDGYSSPHFFSVNTGAAAFRITGITFRGGSSVVGGKTDGFLYLNGSTTALRIDHSVFDTRTYGAGTTGGIATSYSPLNGVLDHNIAYLVGESNGYRDFGGGSFGDLSWSQATGLGSSNFIFLENNIFNGGFANDCNDGGRMVIRYNTIMSTPGENDTGGWQGHQQGQGTQRDRGCRVLEVYHNYILNPAPGQLVQYTPGGGGSTGVAWGNIISAGYQFDLDFWNARQIGTGHSQTAPPNGIGYCGTASTGVDSVWDGNSISGTGYPCIGQTGRGQGDLLNGLDFPSARNTTTGCVPTSPPGCSVWPHNLLEPWYSWAESIASGQVCTNPAWSGVAMQANRDFYCQISASPNSSPSAPFNGSSGTGFGPTANRPASCTAGAGGAYGTSPTGSYGVAYFDTTANHLYVCTAANTWTNIYTPYSYPHPLAGGGQTQPSAPVNLQGVPH